MLTATTVEQQGSGGAAVMGMDAPLSSDALLTQVVSAGATWVRRSSLSWSAVEPSEGERKWDALAPLEAELRAAAQRKLNVILIVRDTPAWAQARAGTPCGPVRADRRMAFGAFMGEVVARYGKPPFNVLNYEIGNEPDINPAVVPGDSGFGCWGDPADPYFGGGVYGEMLKAVYPQVKTANPRAQVLVGGLLLDCDPTAPPAGKTCVESRFLEGILRAGGGPFFDVVSFHAYDFYGGSEGNYLNPNWSSASNTTGPVITRKAQFLRDVLARYGLNKSLMCTEVGVVCWECAPPPPEFERTKANYVPQAYAVSKAAGLVNAIWYSWEGWFGTGMVGPDGQPTSALKAYQVASANLGRATFVRERADVTGARVYEFRRGTRRFWVMWPANGAAQTVTLPATPARVFDALGQTIKPSASLALNSPVYVEWR